MPRVKPGERQRARKPKTKTGCITCKVRRVKCDEAKPACLRCTSTGRKCDGYSYELDKSPAPGSTGDIVVRTSVKSDLVVNPFGTERERRSWDFFCIKSVSHLSGFYGSEFWGRLVLQAAHHDQGIRHALIALSSVHERYERQHEFPCFSFEDDGSVQFALKQYNLAIQRLISPSSKDQQTLPDVHLVSCIIFICIEALRGHVPSAVALVKNGRTMLQQIRSRDQNRNKPASSTTSSVPDQTLNTVFNRLEPQDNCGNDDTATKGESKTRLQHENNNQNRNASAAASREPYVSTQELETLFTRLELQVVEVSPIVTDFHHRNCEENSYNPAASCSAQASTHSLTRPRLAGSAGWGYQIRKDLDALPVPIAPSFTSLAQVRDSLEYYWHDYMASTAFEYTSEAEIARLQRYAAIFKQWSSNFDSFVKLRGSTLSESERRGVAALRMQRNSLWASLNIQKPGEDDQMLWDAYLPLFKENVSLAATAVGVSLDELDDLSTPSPPKAPCFSLDIGIVGPLFALARKCRHPLIRRQAIKLLRAAPRQEGFWDGMMAARVAERVVELEEEGLTDVKECADVPDACRISEIWPVFDYESRQATVRYARPNRASGVPGRDLTETFVW